MKQRAWRHAAAAQRGRAAHVAYDDVERDTMESACFGTQCTLFAVMSHETAGWGNSFRFSLAHPLFSPVENVRLDYYFQYSYDNLDFHAHELVAGFRLNFGGSKP